jgi:hypothetical protein
MTFDRAEHRTRPVCLGTPLATCTLPVGANYLLTYLLSGLWTIWELNEVLDSTTPCAVSDVVPRTKEILLLK